LVDGLGSDTGCEEGDSNKGLHGGTEKYKYRDVDSRRRS
jgi:hypothetical protein